MENRGFVVSPLVSAAVNIADTSLFPECLERFMDFASLIGLDTRGSALTLDSGFDSRTNAERIEFHDLVPVVKPNRRRETDEEKINERLDAFDEKTYKRRFCVERTFAWEDSYRKLSQCYETLEATRNGFRSLAHAMINLRQFL